MTNPNITRENLPFGASESGGMKEAQDDTRLAMNGMGHRLQDELHSLSDASKEALAEAKYKLEKEARHVRASTENYIHQAPINSVLIAAGVGAVAALGVRWLMRSRQH